MTLPKLTRPNEILTSSWLNTLHGEVRSNALRSGGGLRVVRGANGTVVSVDRSTAVGSFPGRRVTVLNKTGSRLSAWGVAGIEKTTAQNDLTETISEGVAYTLRAVEANDLLAGWVVCAESIDNGEAGQAYISGDGILARVKYKSDGSEDDFEYAEIDPVLTGEEAFLYPRVAGTARILDVEKTNSPEGWRWAIIRFPLEGGSRIFKATTTEANGEVKGKWVDLDGKLIGAEYTLPVFPKGK